MLKPGLIALLLLTGTALLGQGAGQRGQRGAPTGAAGARGGAAPDRTATGFGTTNTLPTIPEAGAGSAADDPTPEQLAASPEAQAIIANAKKIAGSDLAREAAAFCTWNGAADVPPRNPAFGTVQVFDNLYYSGTGSVGAWIIKTSEGIILWDTLNSEDEVKTILEPGMKKLPSWRICTHSPPPGAHPLLWTPEKAARYMEVELECGRARIAANRTALDRARNAEYYHTPDPPAAAVAPRGRP